MKRVCPSRRGLGRVLIGKNMVCLSIDHETAILDAVCVAAWNAAEMRMLTVLLLSAFTRPTLHPSPKNNLPISNQRDGQRNDENLRSHNN